MKKLLMTAVLLGTTFPVFGQGCNCNELQRRLFGLQNVLNYQAAGADAPRLSQVVRRGQRQYQRALRNPYPQYQEGECSVGNQELNYDWIRWQAWLATQGLDPGNVCG